MRRYPLLSLVVALLLVMDYQPVTAQSTPRIDTPAPGQALQGVVLVSGDTQVEGFQAAELSFSYDNTAQPTWFLIQRSDQPVSAGQLGSWDTTVLSDGAYSLRLRVVTVSGESQETIVRGLRVRNYTAIETETPTPPAATEQAQNPAALTVTPTLAPTATPILPTATGLPANPAEVTPAGLQNSLLYGGLGALGFLVLLGLYLLLRAAIDRS